jgi:hypothetical protein
VTEGGPGPRDVRGRWRWLRPPPGTKPPGSDRPPVEDEDDDDLLGYGDGDDEGPEGDNPD